MKILVHDIAAYVFIRDLAARFGQAGHEAVLVTCDSIDSPNNQSAKNAEGLRTEVISLNRQFPKYNIRKRILAERAYGQAVMEVIRHEQPDVVMSANGPLLAQSHLRAQCAQEGIPFVFWVQDLYGPAAAQALSERMPETLARLMAAPFARVEKNLLERSDHVISIGENLSAAAISAGVSPRRLTTIPNWADPEAISVGSRTNDWANRHGLHDTTVFLYSGTLGKKHPFESLGDLGRIVNQVDGGRLVVVSEGLGAGWLDEHAPTHEVQVLPFQPESEVPEVLASSDVLVLLIGNEASQYSVPSKFYTYACAGRPVLAMVPTDSEIARTVTESGCGLIVNIGDEHGLAEAVEQLQSPDVRAALGVAGRKWANESMNLDAITEQFISVLRTVTSTSAVPLKIS